MAGKPPSDELDRLVHERMRLGIISALAAEERLSFGDLKGILNTSDGNLSVHARKLEDAGYIEVTKGFEDRKPKTEYSLTSKGRKALEIYIDQMETLLSEARDALEKTCADCMLESSWMAMAAGPNLVASLDGVVTWPASTAYAT